MRVHVRLSLNKCFVISKNVSFFSAANEKRKIADNFYQLNPSNNSFRLAILINFKIFSRNMSKLWEYLSG